MKYKIILIFNLLLFLNSCDFATREIQEKREVRYAKVIETKFGKNYQSNLYKMSSDTLNNWIKFNLIADSVLSNLNKPLLWNYQLDSTICINSSGTKMIGTLHQFGYCEHSIVFDDITEFFGAKIKDKWYFWTGGSMPIIRKSFKNHDPTKPLSYQQLHKAAMENFLGGYLTKSGEINDAWFESKFKGSGWLPFNDRYQYKSILDGLHIDNEDDYYDYQWKKGGLMNWIMKAKNDSIKRVNQSISPKHITREEEVEITMYFSRKLIKGN